MESKFSTIPIILQEEPNQLGNIVLSDDAKTPKENIVVSDVGMMSKGKRRKRKSHYPAPCYLKIMFYEFKVKFQLYFFASSSPMLLNECLLRNYF